MKLKGISFPEPRLTHAIQERVSPWLLPPPSYSVLSLSVVQPYWPGSQLTGQHRLPGSHPGAPGPESKDLEGLWRREDAREMSERSLSPPTVRGQGLNRITSTADEPAHPSWHMQAPSK